MGNSAVWIRGNAGNGEVGNEKNRNTKLGMGSGRNGKWKKWEVGGIGKRNEWNEMEKK